LEPPKELGAPLSFLKVLKTPVLATPFLLGPKGQRGDHLNREGPISFGELGQYPGGGAWAKTPPKKPGEKPKRAPQQKAQKIKKQISREVSAK